mmetsp:Transcript_97667/g.209573  ORF Transcript_97667/g.209573 Transcript_97667/m.209573 type:complete len:415 (-) Transcript_97667:136-1380(-)
MAPQPVPLLVPVCSLLGHPMPSLARSSRRAAGPGPAAMQQSSACGLQGRSGDPLKMPRGDDPEDSWGIRSWEVRAKAKAGVDLVRGALSMESERDEATTKERTGGQMARFAFSMVSDEGAIPRPSSQKRRWRLPNFPKDIISRLRRGRLSPDACALIEELFRSIDKDGSGEVTRSEAGRFFGQGFGKMSANAMFSEVDTDNSQAITVAEFRSFWEQVKSSGYTNDEIIVEVEEMLEGGHWVDFDDQRRSLKTATSFSTKRMQQQSNSRASKDERAASNRRPCCLPRFASISNRLQKGHLSFEARELIKDIFNAIDKDGSDEVTKSEALEFFGDGFGKMSVQAMFDEVDTDESNAISVEEFRAFWEQVKRSGYTNQEIVEELRSLLGGGAWVDFDDTRQVAGGCKSKSAKHMMKR